MVPSDKLQWKNLTLQNEFIYLTISKTQSSDVTEVGQDNHLMDLFNKSPLCQNEHKCSILKVKKNQHMTLQK